MIFPHILNGNVDDYGYEYVADFLLLDTSDMYHDSSGMHMGGTLEIMPWLRFSNIYIVRQRDMWRTLKVFCHELVHALVWLFHLPRKWSLAIDGIKEKR